MKPYWIRLTILGAMVFFITLAYSFPAARVVPLFHENSQGRVQWQNVSGSVFHARIEGLSLSLQDNLKLTIDKLDLDTSFLALLTGRINTDLNAESEGGRFRGKLRLGLNNWSLKDLTGEINLDYLNTIVPELDLLKANGELELSAPSVSGDYHELPSTVFATLTIRDLQLGVIIEGQQLGSYQITLSRNDQDIFTAGLATIPEDSQLIMEGDGHYNPVSRQAEFKGQAWVTENSPDKVKEILPLIGDVRNNRVLLDWQKTL